MQSREDRKAKRKAVLAACLGTAVVILVQYPSTPSRTEVQFYSACVLSFAVPLMAWGFLTVCHEGDFTKRQLMLTWAGLVAFALGFLGTLLVIGYLPPILFGIAAVLVVFDYLAA